MKTPGRSVWSKAKPVRHFKNETIIAKFLPFFIYLAEYRYHINYI